MHHCSIDDQLHGRGLKKTHPRHRILELFAQPRLWSVDALRASLHDVSVPTLYRTLRLLREEGVIVATNILGKEMFERASDRHHDHITCTSCTAVECLPCPIPNLSTHMLTLDGTCTRCKA